MVKRKALLLIAAVLLICSCGVGRQLIDVHPESLVVAGGASGACLSLALAGDTLLAVYPDTATTTLDMLQVPVGPHLPERQPAAAIIDKVDVAPPLSPRFGEHVLTALDGTATVLYLDRVSDAKTVLKAASRPLTETQWSLDILEPAGDPLAALPDGKGAFDAFWAAGSLLSRKLSGSVSTPLSYVTPFKLNGRARFSSADGFTAFDSESNSLLAIRRSAAGFTWMTVPGAGPVHASLVSSSGILSVLSWDPRTRRLGLWEQKPSTGSFTRSTVTLCDSTDSVALLPGPAASTYLFLFDESRTMGGGKTLYQLSLIAPASRLGKGGARYRKAVLVSGETPIDAFAAVETADALYALVLQGNLILLRVGLSP